MMNKLPEDTLGPPTATEVRDAILRILRWPRLARSTARSKVLEYIVEQALSGNAHRINAYGIAVEALGRKADWDPQGDSIVRVEAMRLRADLREYYGSSGLDDPVMISIPKGRYKPVFGRAVARSSSPNDRSRSTGPRNGCRQNWCTGWKRMVQRPSRNCAATSSQPSRMDCVGLGSNTVPMPQGRKAPPRYCQSQHPPEGALCSFSIHISPGKVYPSPQSISGHDPQFATERKVCHDWFGTLEEVLHRPGNGAVPRERKDHQRGADAGMITTACPPSRIG
jgi:hypothetical protein